MEALTTEQAIQALTRKEFDLSLVAQLMSTPEDVSCVISNVTKVKTAAAHKQLEIFKVSKSKVILPQSGDTYKNMVKQSAIANGAEETVVESYTVSESPYQHTTVYPICELKSNPEKKYLYAIYEESTAPVYLLDGAVLSKEDVAQYLTASDAKKLLDESVKTTDNKTHGFSHSVQVRTIGVDNIVSLEVI